jgi:formylglycine-generating enzyme required for sulfatase activity
MTLPALPLLLSLGIWGGPFTGLEHERRPQKLEPFWYSVMPAQTAAPSAAGIVALRAKPGGRVRIAGGTFVMGSTTQQMQEAMQLCAREPLGNLCTHEDPRMIWSIPQMIRAEGHVHDVTLSDFELDVTEVTVEAYMRCVSAGACSHPAFAHGDSRYDQPRFPVTHVRWDDAEAYCRWAGGRLPTEAEWEMAARGRVDNTFPWGKVYNPHLANHGSFSELPEDATDGFLGLAPVGSLPDGATPNGLLDMAGNAAEWVYDLYERDEQQFGYGRGAKTNPTGPTSGGDFGRVVRGGSFESGAFMLRAAARRASKYYAKDTGFRCAADVTPDGKK